MEGIDFFVKILSKSKKEGRKNFRSLEVRGKLIALKKNSLCGNYIQVFYHIQGNTVCQLGRWQIMRQSWVNVACEYPLIVNT